MAQPTFSTYLEYGPAPVLVRGVARHLEHVPETLYRLRPQQVMGVVALHEEVLVAGRLLHEIRCSVRDTLRPLLLILELSREPRTRVCHVSLTRVLKYVISGARLVGCCSQVRAQVSMRSLAIARWPGWTP